MNNGTGSGSMYYEMQPRELVDMCLQCKRKRCSGNCNKYKEKEREINRDGRIDNEGKLLPKGGSIARKYSFRGGYITDKEMADMLGVSLRTVRNARRRGMNMEEIYRYYEQKHRLKGT